MSGNDTNHIPFEAGFSCRVAEFEQLNDNLKAIFGSGDEGDADDSKRPSPISLVSGLGGMGKSRLLTELRESAQEQGIFVKESFCHERQGVPFLPILRMVKDLIRNAEKKQELWKRYAHVLSRVYPVLAQEFGQAESLTELSGEDGKVQLFDALVSLLRDISHEQPLLLLMHDVHRSDPGTIEFLEFLGRNLFLDQRPKRSDNQEGVEAGDEDWKLIRRRNEAEPEFVSELAEWELPSLATETESQARIMLVANFLDVCATETSKPEDLHANIAKLRSEKFVLDIQLPPLELKEAVCLIEKTLGGSLPEDFMKKVFDLTGGNPLFALELCRCLYGDGVIEGQGEGLRVDLQAFEECLKSQPVADTSEEDSNGESNDASEDSSSLLGKWLVAWRLKSASELENDVVRLLAALRRPAQSGFLAEVLEKDVAEINSVLADLEGRQFVKEINTSKNTVLYFLAHEDYVCWAYRDIAQEEVAQLHQRIGSLLSKQSIAQEPMRAFEIYEHFRRAQEPALSMEAGLRASRYFQQGYALELACKIQSHLLSLVQEKDQLEERLKLLRELGELELRRGEVDIAKTHFKMWLDKSANDKSAERLEVYVLLSDCYREKSEPHKGIKMLQRALKQCAEVVDEKAKARFCGLRARLRLQRKDEKRAISLCLQGLKILEGSTDSYEEQVLLLEVLAEAHVARGETVAAIPHFTRLQEIVEEAGDSAKLASVLSRMGRVYYDRGNYFRSARFLFKALDETRRLKDLRGLSRAYDELGKVYRNSGDPIRGIEYFNRCLRLRERMGDLGKLSPTLNSLGSLYAHIGHYFRAVRYFKRSVENSERYKDTAGLVRGFLHLARVYLEIGQPRQVETLAKQILILSQEFDLLELEGEGHRLNGNLSFLRGDWKSTEKEYRRAIEIATKRNRKTLMAATQLDMGELLADQERYEEALKVISKGQLTAEEMRTLPLQARAQLLKGNVYRFFKGGNPDRAKESFHKGIELLAAEHPLPQLWELEYSLAKVCQSHFEFAESSECYARAQAILERIAATLPDDMKVSFHDDRRRKVFFEDYRRFRRESAGRIEGAMVTAKEEVSSEAGSPVSQVSQVEQQEQSRQLEAGSQILDAIARIAESRSVAQWSSSMLEESRRLVPSPAGAIIRVNGDDLSVLSCKDLGDKQEWFGSESIVRKLCKAVAESGKATYSGTEEWKQLLANASESGASCGSRSMFVAPLFHAGELQALLYLERPSAGNPFAEKDQELLQPLFLAVAGQLRALSEITELRSYRGTELMSLAGLDEQLEKLSLLHASKKRSFSFIEVFCRGLDALMGLQEEEGPRKNLIQELIAIGGPSCLFVSTIGNSTLVYAFDDGVYGSELEERIKSELAQFAQGLNRSEELKFELRSFVPEAGVASAQDLVGRMRMQLLRRSAIFTLDGEIDRLVKGNLSLKEAKGSLERRYITAELSKSRGNITRAAESLGVHRPQLSNLIKKYNVRKEDFE